MHLRLVKIMGRKIVCMNCLVSNFIRMCKILMLIGRLRYRIGTHLQVCYCGRRSVLTTIIGFYVVHWGLATSIAMPCFLQFSFLSCLGRFWRMRIFLALNTWLTSNLKSPHIEWKDENNHHPLFRLYIPMFLRHACFVVLIALTSLASAPRLCFSARTFSLFVSSFHS